MLYSLGLIFLLITVIGSKYSLKMNNKIVRNIIEKIGIYICFLFLALYRGGLVNIPDYGVYKSIYTQEFFDKDVGFGFLTLAIKNLGFDINQYRLICGIIGLVFLYLTVKKYLDNKGILLFLLLYFLFPFFFDAIQIRNYLAMSIFCYAFTFLVEDNKKGIFLFCLFMIIAVSMQKTLLFYFPFIVFCKTDKKKFLKYSLYVWVVIAIILGLNRNIIVVLIEFLLNNVSDKLSGSATFFAVNTRFGWMYLWLISFINTYIIWRIRKFYMSNALENKLIELIFWVNIYSLLALPLYAMDTNFFRIERNLQPLNIIAFVCMVRDYKTKGIVIKGKSFQFVFLVMILSIILMQFVTIFNEDLFKYFIQGFSESWIF